MAATVTVDGKPIGAADGVKWLRGGRAVECEVGAGKYQFVVRGDQIFQTWIAK